MSDDRFEGPGESRPEPGRSLTDALTEVEALELLPAFVIGALEPDEMLAMDAFLYAHPEWQARVQSMEAAAMSLAHAAPRVALPARTKEHLMAQARADGAILPAPPAEAPAKRTPLLPAAPAAQQAARPLRGLRPIPPAQPRAPQPTANWFGVFWRTVAAAGAAAAILLLAGITWQLRSNVAQLSGQVSSLQSQLAELEGENAQLQQINGTLQQQLQMQSQQLAVLANPQQTIALAGTEDAASASGVFYRQGGDAVLVVSGLPALSDEQTYQLWLLPPEGDSVPADLIQLTGAAMQTVAVSVPPQHEHLIGIGVSIEPAGGSLRPTTIVLLGLVDAPSARQPQLPRF